MISLYQIAYSQTFDIYTASNKKIYKIERILFLTGREAIIENGNWYMVYKDKEPEV